jgi:hypothetical protein
VKKIGWLIFILTVLCVGAGSAYATAFVINDDPGYSGAYWGGKLGPGYFTPMDVLGDSRYDLNRMEISFNGTVMTVKIIGDFKFLADHGGADGDLYLSSKGWTAAGTGHHETDTFSKAEGWDYVVSRSGVWKLGSSYIETSGGRIEQAYQDGYDGSKIADVTRTLDDTSLTFMFDSTNLGLGSTFGVHFTEACGNDIIEGEVPGVPEPSTALLLIGGLAGLGMMKMRKRTS